MPTPFLRITRFPYEEPHHLNLVVAASNGRQRGEIEIYVNADDLTTAARALAGFPKRRDDVFLWELGSEAREERWACHFRLRVFQVTGAGRCALELRFHNNGLPPHQEVTEFCLHADPADLDRLADLLQQFGRLEHTVLEWTVQGGELRD